MINLYTKKSSGKVFTLLAAASFLASIVFALMFSGKENTSNIYLFCSFLFPQLANILVIIYLAYDLKINPLKALPYKKTNLKFFILAVGLFIGCIFGLGFINNAFISLLNKIGLKTASVSIPNGGIPVYLLSLVVIAVLPALLEETLFRGFILSGLKNCKIYTACILTGVLFAIFHGSASQLIYQFIIGFLLALLTVKSGSVIPAIVFHFLNNAFVLTVEFFIKGVNFEKWYIIIPALIVLISCVLYLVFAKSDTETQKNPKYENEDSFSLGYIGVFYFCLLIILGVIV